MVVDYHQLGTGGLVGQVTNDLILRFVNGTAGHAGEMLDQHGAGSVAHKDIVEGKTSGILGSRNAAQPEAEYHIGFDFFSFIDIAGCFIDFTQIVFGCYPSCVGTGPAQAGRVNTGCTGQPYRIKPVNTFVLLAQRLPFFIGVHDIQTIG